ncbi:MULTISPECIES: 2,3-bisphosphoglycerate-independent phosphoglycerate mutase [Clostridium]|uniref:2,3-bisphosphoglycerate-independent phosphoglycerate mutase n=1 Tax=Clostridium colicanis DSM 13634 TaxID=1121305 RepID=A0A151AND5_9CLOT|nr:MULTISPECIES: 2,3-bisphosphoglycerate-independent phosphoglycerate mutase [Clostridium]KYH29070.1 2,3-bisphosphoglycerate-independent phosphoglycerate mutase [Clostridium colicanis DSM 13634]MBE6043819.1 2,3-bisphosphoglycerate-independent phosphoglycerate mutase [Clostridium thermopalmarium]
MTKRPVMLAILDGFGISDHEDGNSIRIAKKPNYDKLWNEYPHTQLGASGLSVGLPEGQMGNSEVGHLNIGAGRIIYQALTRITKAIEDGDLDKNEALLKAINNVKANNSSLHFMGLLSDGGVHSHIDHLKGLIDFAAKSGIKKVYVHAFLDGRDTPPDSAPIYVKDLENHMNSVGVGTIATISGRYYAMDRDKRWERTQLAYNALVLGKGEYAKSALEAIEKSYHDNKQDEFVLPTVILKNDKPVATIKDGDSVVFFNFRPDRARQITRAINDKIFDGFERENLDLTFVTLTEYDKTIENVEVAFGSESYKNTFGEYLSKLGKKQLRIAETEKYAHVTFFFNGGIEEPYANEDRVLIPSPKVATYDLKPEMSAYEVTDEVIKRIDSDEYDAIILNYANPDMVGHTGVMDAAIKAVEAVDECLGRVVDKILEKNGSIFITADHGNCEQMIDYSTGGSMTAHTTNPVPFIYVSNDAKKKELRESGILADIAPTMLEEMGLEIPKEMTGKSIFK